MQVEKSCLYLSIYLSIYLSVMNEYSLADNILIYLEAN